MRLPTSSPSPQHPVSPPLSDSTPESVGSGHVGFPRSSRKAASPALISPGSGFGSSPSNTSPISMPFHALPDVISSHPIMVAMPQTGTTNLSSISPSGHNSSTIPSLFLHSQGAVRRSNRHIRPNFASHNTTGTMVKDENEGSHDEGKSAEEEGEDSSTLRGMGSGLSQPIK